MKKRTLAAMLGIMMTGTMLIGQTAYAAETGTETQVTAPELPGNMQEKGNTVVGEVTAVSSSSITIAAQEMGQGMPGESSEETTAEETTVTITDETTFSDQGPGFGPMGGMRPSDMGQASNGEAPSGELPSGEAPSGELPSGELPSGEAPSGELPSGEAPTFEAPTSDTSSDSDTEESESETLSIADIEVGDMVFVTVDDEGNAISISVQSDLMSHEAPTGGMPPFGGAPMGEMPSGQSDTTASDTTV